MMTVQELIDALNDILEDPKYDDGEWDNYGSAEAITAIRE